MKNVYIVVDVETSGPVPGEYSMLSIGACVAFDRSKRFYEELKPAGKKFTKRAMGINKLSFRKLQKEGADPRKAMLKFEKFVRESSSGGTPVFVAFPAVFDWMFVNYYFMKYLGRNPFERRVLDMKSYFAGKFGMDIAETTRDDLFKRFPASVGHTHNALDDATGYAESFEQLMKPGKAKSRN